MYGVGALMITLSGITPAASVFVVGSDVIRQAGTGAFICFAAAAVVSLLVAFVYAELASAFPLTGAEYSILGRVLGPAWGFTALGLNLVGGALAQALVGRGLALYLAVVIPGSPSIPIALAAVAISTLVAALNVRVNALITGVFLAIELLALGVITGLGVLHPHHGLAQIALHPAMLSGAGLKATPLTVIGLATAGAIFAYNGYGNAISFGEELHDARRSIARVVVWSLVVAVIAEFIPVIAVLIGANDLRAIFAAPAPLPAFITAAGGPLIAKAVSLAVAFAILNAMIAGALINARQFYASGRDGVWPMAWNRAIVRTHARFHSPWVATLITGVLSAAACFLDLNTLVMLTANGIVTIYAGVCVAALVGRRTGATAQGLYRMPFFPATPILALAALAGVVWADLQDADVGLPSLAANVAVMGAFAAYHHFVLRRRGGWVLRGPDGDLAPEGAAR
jgi:amino acid transporter